jgi:hypothetical protein
LVQHHRRGREAEKLPEGDVFFSAAGKRRRSEDGSGAIKEDAWANEENLFFPYLPDPRTPALAGIVRDSVCLRKHNR